MGALGSLLERFRPKKPDPAVVSAIRTWVFEHIDPSAEDITVSVNEIDCNDPACPGVETVVLIIEKGKKTRACKVGKKMEEVTKGDLRTALNAM